MKTTECEILKFIRDNQIESVSGRAGYDGPKNIKVIVMYGACKRAELNINGDLAEFQKEGEEIIGFQTTSAFKYEIDKVISDMKAEIEVLNKAMSDAKNDYLEHLEKMREIFASSVNRGDFDEMLEEMLAMGFDKMMEKE